MIQKSEKKMQLSTTRSPNLSTILMVETVLRKHRATPMKLAELRRRLPRQVMHQTLGAILEYLHASGKIIYGPRGVQWIYNEPEHLKRMLNGALQLS
jgi:hypothetical protein